MFHPARCPYRSCSAHHAPRPGFYKRHGSYVARCRPHPIPRFICRSCGRSFSRQTFRMDYRDHRPDLNARLFELLASGIGLRQSARMLHLSRNSTERKFRKIGRHLRRLNLNLRGPLPPQARLQLDEFETFEGRRNTRPLSVPVLIEAESRFLIWAEAVTIPPSGKMTPARRQAIAWEQRRRGKRRNCSHLGVWRTLRRGAALCGNLQRVRLATDEKVTYPGLAERAFGAQRLVHTTTNSREPRTVENPLFAINHTEAIARDLTGRLRRESWLVSKKRRYLDLALHIFMAYRNYVRRRFNHDDASAAQRLGFLPRRLRVGELLSWRQEWGERSIHPLATRGESVAQWRAARAA